MALQFYRAIEHMEVWSASRDGFSFVITHGSRAGRGFRGQPRYVASFAGVGRVGKARIGCAVGIDRERILTDADVAAINTAQTEGFQMPDHAPPAQGSVKLRMPRRCGISGTTV